MRPAYETLVAALKQDINRLDEYEWNNITEQLLSQATPPERYYLEKELNALRYEYTTVQLSKLVLGVRDDESPVAIDNTRSFYGRSIDTMLRPTPYIKTSGVNTTDPRQMELDL